VASLKGLRERITQASIAADIPQPARTTAKTVAIEVSHASRLVLRVVNAQMRKPSALKASSAAAIATTACLGPGP
jgi:hypothetical protein